MKMKGLKLMTKKKNVLFIMTDKQRADSIGPNRVKYADYPNMEKLRSESIAFNNFFTAASPCVPSRHTFLTGRHPWKTGVSGNAKFSTGKEVFWLEKHTCIKLVISIFKFQSVIHSGIKMVGIILNQ